MKIRDSLAKFILKALQLNPEPRICAIIIIIVIIIIIIISIIIVT